MHCAAPSVDGTSLITMVLLKTGGNVGCFARWHQASKNPEHIGSKTRANLVEKGYEKLGGAYIHVKFGNRLNH